MRWIVIATAVIWTGTASFALQVSSSIPTEIHSGGTQSSENVENDINGNSSIAAPTPIQDKKNASRDEEQGGTVTQDNKQQIIAVGSLPQISTRKDWWDKTYIVFTFLLVLIGGGTLGAILYQAIQNKKSADAANASANAALLNVQTLINSERAWIDGEIIGYKIPGTGLTRYSLKLTNHGKTAARVLGYHVHHGFMSEGAEFSNETLNSHFSEKAYLLVGSTETKTIRDDWNMDDIYANPPEVLSRGAFRVTIQYRDIVGVDKTVHETKLHFVYKVFYTQLEPMYEYNDYT